MGECWHSDPVKRPIATDIHERIVKIKEKESNNPIEIKESLNIGPVKINNPGAIYKSRPLSAIINSAMSLWSKSINLEKSKRRLEDNLIEDNDGRGIKRNKLYEEDKDYLTSELGFDLDENNECIVTY
ncbi:hypothetical protein RhiirA1_466218 [Rhizophagus irregularis]|uniref:Serine-threonine/tyrosine-protein kinase catalytic domain-containing protein n=1 Tax=Rhizophagus irregularis TaxID=588596 RepID=A0A2N0REG2_9GLOM|nr:hypothetical protein RhiirA1_466218 [Rhizophagus irregularis]CAB5211157.1 unnamed protein product [Rhizophagus irregularis]